MAAGHDDDAVRPADDAGSGGIVRLPLIDARQAQPRVDLDVEDETEADGLVRGYMHSTDTHVYVNGPGMRYTLFLSGCGLRCLYCHNPDTWQMRMGQKVTVDHVVDDLASYVPYLTATGGGFTVSGGEPLVQPVFLEALFRRVKERLGLHIALDTAGFLGARASDELLDMTDLVLLDIKSGDPETYLRVTGRELEPTLRFAERLSERGNRMWIRYVLVPNITDDPENIRLAAEFVGGLRTVDRVEVLPYHPMGTVKYEALGWVDPLAGTPWASADEVEAARAIFRQYVADVR